MHRSELQMQWGLLLFSPLVISKQSGKDQTSTWDVVMKVNGC